MEMSVPSVPELQELRTRLIRFTKIFADCFVRASTRKHLRTYITGQTSALERKSIEPIALAAGTPPRTLQEFLSLSRWDHDQLRARVLQHVVSKHADPAAIALIDETSFPKKGEKTAGVHAGTKRVDQAWRRGGPPWNAYHIKETEKGPVVWEVRADRFWPSYDGQCLPEGWLLQLRHTVTGEIKYFLSNAPQDTPLEVLLHVAFARAEIEQLFEAAKGEVGLDHFEVRNYLPLLRHLIVSLASLLFLAEETTRLREKKLLVEPMSGQESCRSAVRQEVAAN